MLAKKVKLTLTVCCVCNFNVGTTNTLDSFLRDQTTRILLSEVIFQTLGIQVHKDTPNICEECKLKVIEFYHFRAKCINQREGGQTIIQEIMKIVSNFISKKNLKAVTIEESNDRLVIMEKSSYTQTGTKNLIITDVFENVDFKIEKEDEETDESANVVIKSEKIDDEQLKIINVNELTTIENEEMREMNDKNKIDEILNINKEILRLVQKLSNDASSTIT